ncbi:YcxB family protein [Mangrovivirga cuniculi]|uniref:YcxB-like C-terminal domain-containing protein n=1 Tax=Mangrovivirga cuniculi TaxID=2715131 RepID=A0A4D7JWP4_9BACT|nr:YcxB family protein [Mangrovivirga cuniculi]QCK16882.1 hypothetical protein DCC35_20170 [Mangrovivirga cuniculi]
MVTFFLQEGDYLRFFLYQATESKKVQNRKIRNLILVFVTIVFLSVVLYLNRQSTLVKFILAVCVFILIFYPFYFKWRYKSFYKTYIKQNFQDKIGIKTSIWLQEHNLIIESNEIKQVFSLDEIKEIVEIKENYFLYIESGDYIILPRSEKNVIEDLIKGIIAEIKSEIVFSDRKSWQW